MSIASQYTISQAQPIGIIKWAVCLVWATFAETLSYWYFYFVFYYDFHFALFVFFTSLCFISCFYYLSLCFMYTVSCCAAIWRNKEWMNEWMNERTNERTNERMNIDHLHSVTVFWFQCTVIKLLRAEIYLDNYLCTVLMYSTVMYCANVISIL